MFITFLIAGLTYIIPPLKGMLNISDPLEIIKNSVIGLIILMSAYLVLNTINPVLVGGSATSGGGITAPAP